MKIISLFFMLMHSLFFATELKADRFKTSYDQSYEEEVEKRKSSSALEILNKFRGLKEKIRNAEMRMGPDFFPFYHAGDFKNLLAYKVVASFHSRLAMHPGFILRKKATLKEGINAVDYAKRNLVHGEYISDKGGDTLTTMSASYSLFLYGVVESVTHFLTQNNLDGKSHEIILNLSDYGLSEERINKYTQTLNKIISKLREKFPKKTHNGLLQFFIKGEKVNNLAYLSIETGIPVALKENPKEPVNLENFLTSFRGGNQTYYREHLPAINDAGMQARNASQVRLILTSPDFYNNDYVRIFFHTDEEIQNVIDLLFEKEIVPMIDEDIDLILDKQERDNRLSEQDKPNVEIRSAPLKYRDIAKTRTNDPTLGRLEPKIDTDLDKQYWEQKRKWEFRENPLTDEQKRNKISRHKSVMLELKEKFDKDFSSSEKRLSNAKKTEEMSTLYQTLLVILDKDDPLSDADKTEIYRAAREYKDISKVIFILLEIVKKHFPIFENEDIQALVIKSLAKKNFWRDAYMCLDFAMINDIILSKANQNQLQKYFIESLGIENILKYKKLFNVDVYNSLVDGIVQKLVTSLIDKMNHSENTDFEKEKLVLILGDEEYSAGKYIVTALQNAVNKRDLNNNQTDFSMIEDILQFTRDNIPNDSKDSLNAKVLEFAGYLDGDEQWDLAELVEVYNNGGIRESFVGLVTYG